MSLILTPPDSGEPYIPFDEAVARVAVELPDSLPNNARDIMVSLDIDGTLLLPTGASDLVVQNVHDAIGAGIQVVIASGRGVEAIRPVMNHLKIDTAWVVASNGATVARFDPTYTNGVEVIHQRTFNPGHVIDRLVDRFSDIYLGVESLEGFFISRPFPGNVFFEPTWERSLARLRDMTTTRVVAMVEDMDIHEFEGGLREVNLGEIAQFALGWTTWVDINAKGVTKAVGLQDLAEKLGISAQGTVAVGDGLNDIEMLDWASHGVAMGSGLPQVKAAANAVTTTVENEGAAAVLRALLDHVSC